MALNYYSDLKLPDVDSNITFNYNPYSTAPNPNPAASKGSGKTTFTITIKDKDGKVVYTSAKNISSLTLKANDNIKSFVEDYVLNGNDYTITITIILLLITTAQLVSHIIRKMIQVLIPIRRSIIHLTLCFLNYMIQLTIGSILIL